MNAASARAAGIGFVLRNRIAFVCAIVLFIVLAGTGTAAALWKTSASLTASAGVATVSDNSCVGSTFITNGSFETPPVTGVTTRTMSPWVSTDTAGIEVWPDATFSVDSILGDQFIELNASKAATVSQTIVTTPGQTLQWSLVHRGREGTDTMEVLIGASVAAGVSQRTITDAAGAWVRYSGAYTVPANQNSTTFSMKSVSTYNNQASVGNLVDGVSFGTGPCLTSVSTVRNTNNNGGAVRAGDVLEYITTVKNNGGTPGIATVLNEVLPDTLTPVTGSLVVTGGGSATLTAPRTLSARMGLGATATAGGVIDPGITATFRFLATVGTSASGTSIDYSPSVDYADRLAPTWLLSASPAPLTTPVAAGADLVATVTGPAFAKPATTVSYVFALSNSGPIAATGVTITGSFPKSFNISGFTRTGSMPEPNCAQSATTTADVYLCTVGAYAVGASGTMIVSGYFDTGTNANVAVVLSAGSTTTDPVPANNSAQIATTVDGTVPGTVVQTAATATTSNQTTLNWNAASDTGGVVSYNIYSGTSDTIIATSTTRSVTITGLTPGTTTTYRIKAVDGAGNISAAYSNTISVTTPVVPITATAAYTLVNANSALCVDASGKGQTSGTTVVQYPCGTDTNQQWQFVASGSYYVIRPVYTAALSLAPGANNLLQLTTNSTADNQRWTRESTGDGRFRFVNRASGLCLDVPNNATTHNLQLQQYTCNGTTAQSFSMTQVN